MGIGSELERDTVDGEEQTLQVVELRQCQLKEICVSIDDATSGRLIAFKCIRGHENECCARVDDTGRVREDIRGGAIPDLLHEAPELIRWVEYREWSTEHAGEST